MQLLKEFNGLLVVDEAYIDFSSQESLVKHINDFPNLVVLQTFSKAWGLAALRMGIAFSSRSVITILNKVKYPYNVNMLTQNLILEALHKDYQKNDWVKQILDQRKLLIEELKKLPIVEKIYPSDANFVLVKVLNANATYNYLVENKIITRDRSKIQLCDQCLRITVGDKSENKALVDAMKSMLNHLS